jgi:hypothetical protein
MTESVGLGVLIKFLEGLRHAVKAEGMQQFEGWMSEHGTLHQLK